MRRNKTRHRRQKMRKGGGNILNVIKICNPNDLKGETFTKQEDGSYLREGDLIKKYSLADILKLQKNCESRGVPLFDSRGRT